MTRWMMVAAGLLACAAPALAEAGRAGQVHARSAPAQIAWTDERTGERMVVRADQGTGKTDRSNIIDRPQPPPQQPQQSFRCDADGSCTID